MWFLFFLWLVQADNSYFCEYSDTTVICGSVLQKMDSVFNYTVDSNSGLIQIMCIVDNQCEQPDQLNCVNHPWVRDYVLKVEVHTKAKSTRITHASSGYLFRHLINLGYYPEPYETCLKPMELGFSSTLLIFSNLFFPVKWDVFGYYTTFYSLGTNCVRTLNLDVGDKIIFKYEYNAPILQKMIIAGLPIIPIFFIIPLIVASLWNTKHVKKNTVPSKPETGNSEEEESNSEESEESEVDEVNETEEVETSSK